MGATAGILGAANTIGTAAAERGQASAITARADFQSSMASIMAADAVRRGDEQAGAREVAGQRAVGSARAAQAAGGIDPNSGSALDVQSDESKMSALDQAVIKNNAAREAWGYQTQAAFGKLGAQNEAAALRAQSVSTILTGAVKTYGLYSNRNSLSSKKTAAQTPQGTPVAASSYGSQG